MFIVSSFIRGIRARPFSIMALCNIIGDLGYFGFAFDATGFVSLPKLLGSSFTIFAHTILLAYGDEQARLIAAEKGIFSDIFLTLRRVAQKVAGSLPMALQKAVRAKPVGIPFSMLMMNGVGLLVDGILEWAHQPHSAMAIQIILALCVIIGCAAYAMADFIKGQKAADILIRIAQISLSGSTVVNGALVLATKNPFLTLSFIVFAFANFVGFFVRLDKEKGQHLHS